MSADLPRVVGLDPSLTGTGIARTDGQTITVRTPDLQGVARLNEVLTAVNVAVSIDVDLVVVEGPAYSRGLQQGHHEAAGLWWLIAWGLEVLGAPVAVVSPSALKKYATGKGNATKPDMRMALFQRCGIDERDDNRVDAFWLRAAGLDHLGHAPVALPALHRAALDKVAWPEVIR